MPIQTSPHVAYPLFIFLLAMAGGVDGYGQDSAITYQGQLQESGVPAEGLYDLRFTLYDAATDGTILGATTNNATAVSNGLFTAVLDFGGAVFDGSGRWLEVGVTTNGGSHFTALSPRHPVTRTPYAIQADRALAVDMGTLSDPAFLGTTTVQPLELKVNNETGFRLDYVDSLFGLTSVNVSAGHSGNMANGLGATVSGGGYTGSPNQALNGAATVSGGRGNTATGSGSTVGGGIDNTALEQDATVGGGRLNRAEGLHSTVSGGREGVATGRWATIPGGLRNAALGDYSLGAGRRAKALHQGAFVWADSRDADFASIASDQFLIRARGGVAIGTNDAAGAELRVAGTIRADSFSGDGSGLTNLAVISPNALQAEDGNPATAVWVDADGQVGIGTSSPSFALQVQDAGAQTGAIQVGGTGANGDTKLIRFGDGDYVTLGENNADDRMELTAGTFVFGTENGSTAGRVGIGVTDPATKLDIDGEATMTACNITSDRNAKEGFVSVDPLDVLQRVAAMPISEWQYKAHPDARHIGPMAQDFREAFALGRDDRHITSVDADGVALSAIQGLHTLVQEKDAELIRLRAECRTLAGRLATIERALGLRDSSASSPPSPMVGAQP